MTAPRALVLTLLATAVAAAPAQAGIWTPYTSGTTENITAVDYQGDGKLWYTTSNGKIFKNGVLRNNFAPVAFNDIAMSPDGTKGIAVGNLGALYRSTNGGDSWSAVAGLQTRNTNCSGTASTAPLNQDLVAVAWVDNNTAYAVAQDDDSPVVRTGNGGTLWTEVNRRADGSCAIKDELTDVKPVPGSNLVYFIAQSFGDIYASSDALGSTAAHRVEMVNCYDGRPRLALDETNPNTLFASDRCTGSLSLEATQDGGTTSNHFDYAAGPSNTSGFWDIAFAGGTMVAVGNAGLIVNSVDGRNAYYNRADGDLATKDWRATDVASATQAVVAGVGGAMALSTSANAIPDLVAPAGTLTGPTTATAGTPATYTANVADNAGGSGIDPAGFAWSAAGVPNATGNPVTLTFPSAGSYTVKVTFRDLAGNSGEATLNVTVRAAPPTGPVTKTLPYGKATVTAPKACVRTGRKLSAAFKFQRRKGARGRGAKVVQVEFFVDGKRKKTDRRSPYKQKLSTKGLKRGSRHTLRTRVTLRLRGGLKTRTSLTTTFRIC